jgi:hypothetical protein
MIIKNQSLGPLNNIDWTTRQRGHLATSGSEKIVHAASSGGPRENLVYCY